MNKIWISPKVIDCDAYSESSSETKENIRRRAYEIWSHAEQIIDEAKGDLYLVDAVTTLKRTINQRLHALDSVYHFKNIPIKSKPSGLLSQLEYFGIIRQAMLKQLIEIRNKAEHEDISPKLGECKNFLEFTWYFLRSTDGILKNCVDSYLFMLSDDDKYWLNVSLEPKKWKIQFRGWLQPSLLSKECENGFIEVNLESIETKAELINRKKKQKDIELDSCRGRNLEDIYLSGLVHGPQECLTKIIKIYFSLAY